MADYDADVIVVGSGGLGATVALEAGPEIPDWKIIQNWRASPRKENTTDPYGNFPWAPNALTAGYLKLDTDLKRWPNTARVVGGTARHWTGITWRFRPEDFRLRTLRGVGRGRQDHLAWLSDARGQAADADGQNLCDRRPRL
jgi:choline dehydrogenase-like flavoprotein